jgi:hypothetical protein
MRWSLVVGMFTLLVMGCNGDSSKEMEQKYDQLKVDMSVAEVNAIMGGAGKAMSVDVVDEMPEKERPDLTKLPSDTRWVRWGESYPYVLVAFSKDKMVLAQVLMYKHSKK